MAKPGDIIWMVTHRRDEEFRVYLHVEKPRAIQEAYELALERAKYRGHSELVEKGKAEGERNKLQFIWDFNDVEATFSGSENIAVVPVPLQGASKSLGATVFEL